jgi:hypothetical protein
MKHLKIAFSVALTTMALLAVGNPCSAAAEATLCSTNTFPCTGTKYGSGTKISSQLKPGTHLTITTSITNVTCKKFSYGGSTTNGTGHSQITAAVASECTDSSGGKCEVAAANLPWTTAINASGGGNGSATTNGATWVFVCGSLINCTFSSASMTTSLTGGNPATLTFSNEPLERSGGFCPSTADMDAVLEITSPKPLFVV